MVTKLQHDELEQLKNFRLTEEAYLSELSISIKGLLNKTELHPFLLKLQGNLNSPDLKVTASMLVKRYGFFAVLSLYSMTILNKGLNVKIDNISLENNEEKELSVWLPNFRLENLDVSVAGSDRAGWRDNYLKMLFSEHIYKVVSALSKETKISKLVLWENIAIYIFWLYDMLLEDERFSDMRRDQIQEDYLYVVENAPGDLFGPYNKNPLSRYYTPKTFFPEHDKEIRVRKTCCFYYQTTEAQDDHCLTCPITCKRK
ncbi:(2Fe-2S)-binding protein [Cytobacillus suaedae]|nr:(2Fe-2S)-binding protein [Cytobacillus suaedae]